MKERFVQLSWNRALPRLACAFLLFSAVDAVASVQDGSAVRGRVESVTESGEVQPLAGVRVTFSHESEEWTRSVSTDSTGAYRLSGVPFGAYKITVARASGRPLQCAASVEERSVAVETIQLFHSAKHTVWSCGPDDALRIADAIIIARGDLAGAARAVDTITVTLVDTVYEGPRGAPRDTATVYIVTERDPGGGWQLGVGGGLASSFVGGMSFVVPALVISAQRADKVQVSLLGGWRWMGPAADDPLFPDDPRPQFLDRAEAIASLAVSVYPEKDWWGFGFGALGAWETVRELDNYLQRAYGLTAGARVRAKHPANFVIGLDLQLSNLSEIEEVGSRWAVGVVPFITVSYVFR